MLSWSCASVDRSLLRLLQRGRFVSLRNLAVPSPVPPFLLLVVVVVPVGARSLEFFDGLDPHEDVIALFPSLIIDLFESLDIDEDNLFREDLASPLDFEDIFMR